VEIYGRIKLSSRKLLKYCITVKTAQKVIKQEDSKIRNYFNVKNEK
jgi:hypothetical protein